MPANLPHKTEKAKSHFKCEPYHRNTYLKYVCSKMFRSCKKFRLSCHIHSSKLLLNRLFLTGLVGELSDGVGDDGDLKLFLLSISHLFELSGSTLSVTILSLKLPSLLVLGTGILSSSDFDAFRKRFRM